MTISLPYSATDVADSQHTASTRRRVPGLDGLRALAVAVVLIYHLMRSWMPGGMVGVDVFLVISGFLITSLLIHEFRTAGRIDLKGFWVRRVRRLVPAVAVMVVVATAAAAIVGGDALLAIRRQFVGALTYTYNWVEIAAGSSYFDRNQPLLLTHMWSLAIEQQFYLIWPLIVIALLWLARRVFTHSERWIWIVAACLMAASALWALALAAGGADPSRIYMGTDSRAFGLMAGSALALACGDPLSIDEPAPISARTATARASLGYVGAVIIVVVAIMLPMNNSPLVLEIVLILATLGAVGVIQAMMPAVLSGSVSGRFLCRILDAPFMRWIGERSYGIYLWHWPLWVLGYYLVDGDMPRPMALALAALSVVIAEASYRWIETPLRKGGIIATVRLWITSLQERGRIIVFIVSMLIIGVLVTAVARQPAMSSAEQAIRSGQAAISGSQSAAGDTTPASGQKAEGDPSAAQSAAAGAVSGAGHDHSDQPTTPIPGNQITVIGDSVTLAAAPALTEERPGIAINAEVSRSIYQVSSVLTQVDAEYGARPYVVVALATNGDVPPEQLDEVLKQLGPDRRLVLVTGFGPDDDTWIRPAADTIRSWAAAHKDRVRVADWAAAIAEHTDLLASDNVHPDEEGAKVWTRTVLDALDTVPR